jgi:hypothetical protein
VRFCQSCQCRLRGPALTLLDTTELAIGQSLHLRLEYAGDLAHLADGGPIAIVELVAALLGLAVLSRIGRLEELVPAQVNVEVRPVDKRAIVLGQQAATAPWGWGVGRIVPPARATDDQLPAAPGGSGGAGGGAGDAGGGDEAGAGGRFCTAVRIARSSTGGVQPLRVIISAFVN